MAAAALCYWAVFVGGWVILRRDLEATRTGWKSAAWGIGLWCTVAAPSLLQFAIAGMFEAGRRDSSTIASGQWWRLLTSMFLQDGGWFGTAFNLAVLAVSVVLVRVVLPGPRIIAVFLVGGICSNVATILIWPETGAGNSMATMFMVVVAALLTRPWRETVGRLLLVGIVLSAAVLLVLGDIHGLAAASGLLFGVIFVQSTPRETMPPWRG